MADDIEHVICT